MWELDRERGWRLSSMLGEGVVRVVATSLNTDVGGEMAPRELTRAMLPALSPAFMSAIAALSSEESLGLPDLLPERLLGPEAPRLLCPLLALPLPVLLLLLLLALLLLLLLSLRTLGGASVVTAGGSGALAFLCTGGRGHVAGICRKARAIAAAADPGFAAATGKGGTGVLARSVSKVSLIRAVSIFLVVQQPQ